MVTGWMSVNFYGHSSRVWRSVGCRRVYLAADSFRLEDWVRIGKLRERSTRVNTVDDEDIRSSGLVQFNDGLYAEVQLWCASGPIARRWIAPTCIWKLYDCKNGRDCHKRSCWKNSVGMSAPGPYRSDVYVYSKSCRLYLTVVYWLLECNKVPPWIKPTSTLQYHHSPFVP
jgi:hypothetical protein